MDVKTRIRCKVCGSEFDEECTEYYLETDDPESDYIGHCPVCWGIDIAAISIIDPEAIRRECADKAKRAILSAPSDIVTRAYAASLAEEAIVFAESPQDAEKPPCA